MRLFATIAAVLCAVAGAAAAGEAVARMYGTSGGAGNTTGGLVTFNVNADDDSVDIVLDLFGYAPNTVHGMHIHQFGDISDTVAAQGTGAHFNPFDVPHACPGGPRHVGDLGNITSDADGKIITTIRRYGLNFTYDASADVNNTNVIGRGLIVHQLQDNCVEPNTGAAGTRYTQGAIGIGFNKTRIASMAAAEALSARFYNTANQYIGQMWMRQSAADTVEVFGVFSGLVPGSIHGLHVHSWGDHTSLTSSGAGSHWNPNGGTHALPYEAEVSSTQAHMGDLGDIIADAQGNAMHHAFYGNNQIRLDGSATGSPWNIIGRAVVLHLWPDQGRLPSGDPTGFAGARMGMGVLGLARGARFPSADSMIRGVQMLGYAKLHPAKALALGMSNAKGSVALRHGDNNFVELTVHLEGLAANTVYAAHIHEFGDLTNPNGLSSGGHWSAGSAWPHACYKATGKRHFGDIGNLPATDANGVLDAVLFRDWITLVGQNSTVGRAFIVHTASDDCQPPTGNAGDRLLHGTIGNANGTASNPGLLRFDSLVAYVTPTSAATGSPRGWVYITRGDTSDETVVLVNLTDVQPTNTTHGIHVHTYGDWSKADGTAAMGHWNPDGNAHALPGENNIRHRGDLGNVQPDAAGNVLAIIRVLNLPIDDIAGRGIVLHALRDQGSRVADTGGAGSRIALGALGILNPATTVLPVITFGSSSSSTGDGCPPDQVCAGAMTTPSALALIAAAAVALAAVRRV